MLVFDGRVHHLEQGYWIKFAIKRVDSTMRRPHGLSYSFTLHDPKGDRLIGFDKAHGVAALGSRFGAAGPEFDHWHRTGDDPGRPYDFTTADQLLTDVEAEVERVLAERGIGREGVKTGDQTEGIPK